MKRPGPVPHITFALTLLGCAVLVTAQLLWHLFPDPQEREAQWRQAHAESAAAQTLFMLERNLLSELGRTLELAVKADVRIRSIGIRRADGGLLAHTAAHTAHWMAPADGRSTLSQVVVPIHAGQARWGQLEMAFEPPARGLLASLSRHPLAVAVAHFALVAGLLYWLYLRRAMVQLDPAAVIPDRIRAAYEVMTEGVVLLDARGRIVMTNSAFDALPPSPWPDVLGRRLSSLPWLAAGLAADAAQHPWSQVLRAGTPVRAQEVRVGGDAATARRLLINCAPIGDGDGRVRGCIVTFDDVSALQVMNEKLSAALAQLQTSQREIERQNRELERLATRDSLSACLTRGAGLARGAEALEQARLDGTPLCCLLIDIDQFKAVNDGFGHAVGDAVVQRVGRVLQATLGTDAIVSRHGGDEFAAVLPGADASAGHAHAHRILMAMRALEDQDSESGGPRVTVSIGLACFDATHLPDLPALLAAADQALYEAKAQGRDCVRGGPASVSHDRSSAAGTPAPDARGALAIP